jgi:hypothetical protein
MIVIETAGFDPIAPFAIIPPQVIFFCDALVWSNICSLAVNFSSLSWSMMWVVLSESGSADRDIENLVKE